jgi:rhodanese-related sulfurtransferase
MKYRLTVAITVCLFISIASAFHSCGASLPPDPWVCKPCGNDCDNSTYDKSGNCPHCGMPLVRKSTVVFDNISPSEIGAFIRAHPKVVLLDVRTKEEFEGSANPIFGTLKNAINIPVQELESKLSAIQTLKDKDIIAYCSHGHRSAVASYLLTQHGFHHVINMTGGMSVMHDSSVMISNR